MSSVKAYSQMITAVVDQGAWDEVYFSLLSMKSQLQSLPGWQNFEMWANSMEPDAVRLVVITSWDEPDQLEVWMQNQTSVDAILRAMLPPPRTMDVDVYEEIL